MKRPLESHPSTSPRIRERRIVNPTGGAEIIYLDDRTVARNGCRLVTYEIGDCTAVPCWGETGDRRSFAMLLHIPPNKTVMEVLSEADVSPTIFEKVSYKIVPGLETNPQALQRVEEGAEAAFGALPRATQQATCYYETPKGRTTRTKVELNVTPHEKSWIPQITVTGPLNPFD
jgi:hypothetical protein